MNTSDVLATYSPLLLYILELNVSSINKQCTPFYHSCLTFIDLNHYIYLSGSILPATVVQAEEFNATFLCQLAASSGAIEWQINGTSLYRVNAGEGQIIREGRGEATEALTISALSRLME